MGEFDSMLARLRAHVEGRQPLPLDVGVWTIERIASLSGGAGLRQQRDANLCAAGRLIGGTIRTRAHEILRIDAMLSRLSARGQAPRRLGLAGGLVLHARGLWPIPADRQLREILASSSAGKLAVESLHIANSSGAQFEHEHEPSAPARIASPHADSGHGGWR
ncbi:MAG: hypothetical protein QM741_13860 [Rudaea sp.]|uniref:hypothetical protein n=1 Tax=Rudaea sp. TaxID=2136325 RepID=UPI0039E2334C